VHFSAGLHPCSVDENWESELRLLRTFWEESDVRPLAMGEMGLENIRIIQHDAVEVIEHMLADNSLDGVHIFFPDPWHKLRHNKRRLIQTAFVNALVKRLKPGGYLHCATDWQPYAEHILKVMQAEPALVNASQRADGYSEQPAYRPLTKFENRGLKLGHGVWDLVFLRV